MAEKKKFTIKKTSKSGGASSRRIKVPTKMNLTDLDSSPADTVKEKKPLKLKSEAQSQELKITSKTQSSGLKIKSKTQLPGLKIKSEARPQGLKIKSKTQSTEAAGPKPGHKTQLQPRPIQDPLAHVKHPAENEQPKAPEDMSQANSQSPIFPEDLTNNEGQSETLAPIITKKTAPTSSIMGEVKAAKIIKKTPITKVSQAVPTALTGGIVKTAKIISNSPKSTPSTIPLVTDKPQPIKIQKPIGAIKDSLDNEYCLIPQGQYYIGVENELTDIEVSFSLARFPVTVKDYFEFVKESPTQYSADELNTINTISPYPNCPAVLVSWEDAKNYCRWLRKKTGDYYSLPTIIEWEAAARGKDGRIYPWGQEEPNHKTCCFDDGSLQPQGTCSVDYFNNNSSPFGCEGMIGNVMEWTLDSFDDDRDAHILKGGSWASSKEFCNNVTPCMSFPPSNRRELFGLRLLYLTKDMHKTYKDFFTK